MSTAQIIEIAEKVAATKTFDLFTINLWKGERIYVNRPNQSKKHQDCGYIRVSDLRTFPACGSKPRVEADRDAINILEEIAHTIEQAKNS